MVKVVVDHRHASYLKKLMIHCLRIQAIRCWIKAIKLVRDGVKKWYFWVVGAVGGSEARPQLSAKKYHFLFLLPFDAEAFKTCKNTIKLGLGLWLSLPVYFDLA